MATIKLELLPFPDADFMKLAENVFLPVLDEPGERITYHCRIGEGGSDLVVGHNQRDTHPVFSKLIQPNREIFAELTCIWKTAEEQISATVRRTLNQPTVIDLSYTEQFARQEPTKLADLLSKFYDFTAPFQRINLVKKLDPVFAQITEDRLAAMNRIESIHADILKEFSKTRQELVDEDRRRRERGLAELADRSKSEHDALAKRESELTAKAEALETLRKELNDRSNRHARREIYKDQKETLKARNKSFRLTTDTTEKRMVIHVAFVLLIFVFGVMLYLAFDSSMGTPPSGVPAWFPLARLAVSVAALGTSIYAYIRWQDRWVAMHAQEEFRFRRLELDIDRASWLVEMMLEWGVERESQMPKELLDRLAFGLFQTGAFDQPGRLHPAEDVLAALLGNSTNIKLTTPGLEANLDRKAIGKANEQLKP